jgi:predicted nucleic acid-binding protein
LIKRFVAETGSATVGSLVARQKQLATATITYVELYAGLTRKYRQGDLSEQHYALACRRVENEWPSYLRVELQKEILDLARELIRRHGLRGFDAIHLASALNLKSELEENMTFVAADERLLRTASTERLQILNVEKTAPA